MLDQLVISFTIGALGYLIAGPLAQHGEVLAYWPKVVGWLCRTTGKNPYDWNALQYWLSKITYLCAKCIAGNMAVLYSLFSIWLYSFSVGQGCQLVVLSIFWAHLLGDKIMANG